MTAVSPIAKTPSARAIVLLSGLTYVPAAILTPIVTSIQLKRSGVADEQRKLLVKNETVRQAVSAGIHFITYYGGVLLAGKVFNKAAKKPLMELATGILFSTIGHGIIRPMLTNGLLVKWLKKETPETSLPQAMPALFSATRNQAAYQAPAGTTSGFSVSGLSTSGFSFR